MVGDPGVGCQADQRDVLRPDSTVRSTRKGLSPSAKDVVTFVPTRAIRSLPERDRRALASRHTSASFRRPGDPGRGESLPSLGMMPRSMVTASAVGRIGLDPEGRREPVAPDGLVGLDDLESRGDLEVAADLEAGGDPTASGLSRPAGMRTRRPPRSALTQLLGIPTHQHQGTAVEVSAPEVLVKLGHQTPPCQALASIPLAPPGPPQPAEPRSPIQARRSTASRCRSIAQSPSFLS